MSIKKFPCFTRLCVWQTIRVGQRLVQISADPEEDYVFDVPVRVCSLQGVCARVPSFAHAFCFSCHGNSTLVLLVLL